MQIHESQNFTCQLTHRSTKVRANLLCILKLAETKRACYTREKKFKNSKRHFVSLDGSDEKHNLPNPGVSIVYSKLVEIFRMFKDK